MGVPKNSNSIGLNSSQEGNLLVSYLSYSDLSTASGSEYVSLGIVN